MVCSMKGKTAKCSLTVAGGDDMYPALRIGEELEIETVPPEGISAGDVIVFNRCVLIAHRVVGTLKRGSEYFFLTHGDKCPCFDSPVPSQIVIGRVVGKSIPMLFATRTKILFAAILLWHSATCCLLGNPIMRRLNRMVLRKSSFLILP